MSGLLCSSGKERNSRFHFVNRQVPIWNQTSQRSKRTAVIQRFLPRLSADLAKGTARLASPTEAFAFRTGFLRCG